jgi:hypothetical protein
VPDRSEIDDFDRFYFGYIAFNGSFNTGFERHGRHRAITARSDKLELYYVIVCDLAYFNITTVCLQIRAYGV